MRLHTEEDVRRYVRAHIFCLFGSLIFPDKSTTKGRRKDAGLQVGFSHFAPPHLLPRHHLPLLLSGLRSSLRSRPHSHYPVLLTLFVSPRLNKKHPQRRPQPLAQTQRTTQWTARVLDYGVNTETSAACLPHSQRALCRTGHIPQYMHRYRYKTLCNLFKVWASMLWHRPDLSSSNVMVLGT
ncbi:hypothetical protein PIB30_070794 [Stylosanthes scabra]|uniref:Uncharacterized protein n=1 Tax=Stylosanthes scabra TaxID=79078 RepID=A0ABU6YML4_9FABA|nr:hypothetical protein [Stylosanthes scabra]